MLKPFEFGPTIQPIILNKNPIVTGSIVTVTGWGRTSSGGERPLKLQRVQLAILPQWECELLYREENITDNMFCTGRAGRGICSGDSGGPAVLNGRQIGIVSFTRKCTHPVFMNIYTLYDWIHKYTGI